MKLICDCPTFKREGFCVHEGDRIELVEMREAMIPVPVGTKGTVESVKQVGEGFQKLLGGDFQWQVEVRWDNGRRFNLLVPNDKYKKI